MQNGNPGTTSRSFCFTLNNPTSTSLDFAQYPFVEYAIWQLEIGKEGTEHLQGYIEMSKSCRWSVFKNILQGAHFEKRRGTRDQARSYCKKEDTRKEGPWEYGVWSEKSQGKRNDLEEVKRKIDSGASEMDIAEEHFNEWAKYYKAFREYKKIKTAQRNWPMEVELIYGPPGVGKSKLAMEENPKAYWKAPQSKWFDGYEGEEVVILDDFRHDFTWTVLLRLLDRYPMLVECKGGHLQFVAKKIVITTNLLPTQWYDYSKFPWEALQRRITKWIYQTKTSKKSWDNWEDFKMEVSQVEGVTIFPGYNFVTPEIY